MIPHVDVVFKEHEAVDPAVVMTALAREVGVTHVACVHHESEEGFVLERRE